jgi:AcrR family transcriptional regulator
MATVTTGRVGRPRRFEADALISCALSLGPDHLALRDIADALGVPRTTIYNSVRSSDEVGRMVLASLVAGGYDASWENLEHESWQAWLEAFAQRTRDMLLAAGPWLRFWNPELSTPALRTAELVAAHMVSDGLTPALAVRALWLVDAVVQKSVAWHIQHRWSGDPTSEALIADEHPLLLAGGSVQTAAEEEREFQWYLTCAIEGLRTMFERGT